MPMSRAWLPALCAATCAANGVPLREPLKPIRPAEDQARTLPSGSDTVMIVLLKDAWMWATPCGTSRRSFFRAPFLSFFAAPALAMIVVLPYFLVSFFLVATVARRGPLRVRAFVFVRWPRTGSPRRCRTPR